MPIYDQGYRHFEGKKHGVFSGIWAIAREGIRMQWPQKKREWFFWIAILLMALIPFIFLVLVFMGFGYFQDPKWTGFAKMILSFLGNDFLNLYFKNPSQLRPFLWSYFFASYINHIQIFFLFFVMTAVGPKLISMDLQQEGLSIYFSKPVTVNMYIFGKFLVIFLVTTIVIFFPVLLLYLISLFLSPDFIGVFKETYIVILPSFLSTLLLAIPCACIMLFFSSLTKNRRYIGAFWVSIWMISGVVSNIASNQEKKQTLSSFTITSSFPMKNEKLEDGFRKEVIKKSSVMLSTKAEGFILSGYQTLAIFDQERIFILRKTVKILQVFFSEKEKEKKITLSPYYIRKLKKGALGEELKLAFSRNGHYLSQKALMAKNPKTKKWQIKDGDKIFTFEIIKGADELYPINSNTSLFSLWHNFSTISYSFFNLSPYLKKEYLSPSIRRALIAFNYTHPPIYSFLILLILSMGSFMGLQRRLRHKI